MSEERHLDQAIRGLAEIPGSPDFRARLRQQFVDGTLEGDVAARAVEPAAGADRKVVPWRGWSIGLAIAASLFALFLTFNRGPQWELVAAVGEGTIKVGEKTFPASRAAEFFPRPLPPGTRVQVTGEAMLDFVSPGVVAVQMAAGSTMEVPNVPGRWIGRSLAGEVSMGEVRFVTGPDFAGRRLDVAAPAARIAVMGTTFAIITAAESTCVCVLEGEVMMDGADGSHKMVPGGMRRTVFMEADGSHEEEILPMERMKLEMLRDQAGDVDAPSRDR